MLRLLGLCLGWSLVGVELLFGQQVLPYHLSPEDGLPSELCKAVATDSYGYIWVATDDGVARYDGREVKGVGSDHSIAYPKSLFCLPSGNLGVVHDLGITEIQYTRGDPDLNVLVSATPQLTDSTLWYPKSALVDYDGSIWVSEPRAIVRIDSIEIQRYPFDEPYQAQDFLRSFSLALHPDGNVWACAYTPTGGLFRFDLEEDAFQHIQLDVDIGMGASIEWIDEFRLWIGTSSGLVEVTFDRFFQPISYRQVCKDIAVCRFLQINPSLTLVGTWTEGLFWLYTNADTSYSLIPVRGDLLSDGRVKDIYLSPRGEWWVCTDGGLTLLQQTWFNRIQLSPFEPFGYIQALATKGEGELIVADQTRLFRVQTDEPYKPPQVFSLHHDPHAYFLALDVWKDEVWVTSQDEVWIFGPEGLQRRIEPACNGEFLFSLAIDGEGQGWVVPGGQRGLVRIDRAGFTHLYQAGKGLGGNMNVVRHGGDGRIYAAGDSAGVFVLDTDRDRFISLGGTPPVEVKGITDIWVRDTGNIWIASQHGVWSIEGGTWKHWPAANMELESLQSISVDDSGRIWVGSNQGLIQFDAVNQSAIILNEKSGLPSRTFSQRTCQVTPEGKVWVGTSKGLAIADLHSEADFSQTPMPHLHRALVENQQIAPNAPLWSRVPENALVNLTFFVPAFPQNAIWFQYRVMEEGLDWSAPTKDPHWILHDLSAGSYTLLVRAREEGSLQWSLPWSLDISVQLPLWKRWYTLLFGGMILSWGIWLGLSLFSKGLRQKNQKLEQIVAERTRELAASAKEAKAASKAKSEFLANMSHEIRTPMNGLLGMLQLMQGTPLNSEQQDYLHTMQVSGESLLTIINDILDFSKMEAGKLELEHIPVDLEAMFRQVKGMFEPQAKEKGIVLEAHVDRDAPQWILGDPTRLLQVFVNLVGNALKFTESGEVVLMIQRGDSLESAGCSLLFEVRDTGIGISPDKARQLFDAFAQADASMTRKYGGTGLGLAISSQLVQMMGGRLQVKSALGKGSTFFFVLPIEPTIAPSLIKKQVRTHEEIDPDMVVLVAEDMPVNQKLIMRMLAKLGVEAELVGNGAEAVEYVKGRMPDLVFMDVQMPVMDGLAATQAIRELPLARQPRIVAMTANAMEGDREMCLEAGMDEYISKPFKLARLREVLLQTHRQQATELS